MTQAASQTSRPAEQSAPAGCCSLAAPRIAASNQPTRWTSATRKPPLDRLVRLPGGRLRIGSDEGLLPMDGEGPSRSVRIRPFAIDPFAVTNEWFAAFVAETGFRTDAETHGWSAVFQGFLPKSIPGQSGAAGAEWWRRVEGASLAPCRRGRARASRSTRSSCRPRVLERCAGVCRLGRRQTAERSRMGVCGRRRARSQTLPLGRR